MCKSGHRRVPKDLTIEVVVALHRLHFTDPIIAKMTGFSGTYVGRILSDFGARERWSNVADARADLPSALREACDELLKLRARSVARARTANAVTRRSDRTTVAA